MHHKIRKIVHHLRTKPEEERRQILHLFMICVVGIMFIFWILSLGQTFRDPELKMRVKDDLQPFSILKSNLIDGYNSAPLTSPSVVE